MSFIWLASVFFTSVFSLWCQGVNCTPLFGILWPPDVERQLIGKDHDAGKDWGQEEKGMTGWDGWMASLTQCTWVWANSRDSEGQGSLACCSPWGCKELGMTEWLNNNNLGWNDNPLQDYCLEDSVDRGAWQATIHGIAESDMTEWLTFISSHSA